MDTHTTEQRTEGKPGTLDFYDIGIAEILLPPTSRLVNTPVGESDCANSTTSTYWASAARTNTCSPA